MVRASWAGLGLCALGCLGAARPPAAVTPAERLRQAQASAARAEWPAAREGAVAYWVSSCKKSVTSVDDCASAQLVRGEAELATDAPETAFLWFDWALKSGSAAAREKAEAGLGRAESALQTLLERRAPEQTWLVVVHDFEDNHRFGPERAAYTLDGKPLGDVTSPRDFALREHRVVATAIAPGQHQLAVEIHWHGHGTLSNYLWSSFQPVELEAPQGGVVVVSLDVTYKDGGPSNNSIDQAFNVAKLP